MKALVDADSLLYKVGFSIEDKFVWNECDILAGSPQLEETQYFVDDEIAYKTFDSFVKKILFATDCSEALLVFTGKENFRLSLPTSYKENRKNSRKPTGYDNLLAYAKENYTTKTTEYMEADDYVVWLKTKYPEDYILCAIDKDVLYQTEGTHYNYNGDIEVTTTKEEAIYYAYYQTLTGDTSDGYKGCPQVGKVKAAKILDGIETEHGMWEAVVEAYEKAGLTETEALWTMRLAQMHQYDGDKIVYWNPPQPIEK